MKDRLLKRIKTASFMFVVILFILAVLELFCFLALSLRLHFKGGHNDIFMADCYRDTQWVRKYSKVVVHRATVYSPYVHWKEAPFTSDIVNVASDNLRRTWNCEPERQGSTKEARVFMFGGSVLWGDGARDEFTIPSFVAKLLFKEGVAAEVYNFGQGGYVSTQEVLALMRELQKGNIPDVAVFYHGANDVYSTALNSGAGFPVNNANREDEFNVLKPFNRGKLFIRLLKQTKLNKFFHLAASRFNKPGQGLFRFEKNAGDTARLFAANLKIASALSSEFGFRALFFLQPVIFMKQNLTPFEKGQYEQAFSLRDYYSACYPEFRQSLANVDGFHDLSGVFMDKTSPYFIDFLHISEEGNNLIAANMLPDIISAIQAS